MRGYNSGGGQEPRLGGLFHCCGLAQGNLHLESQPSQGHPQDLLKPEAHDHHPHRLGQHRGSQLDLRLPLRHHLHQPRAEREVDRTDRTGSQPVLSLPEQPGVLHQEPLHIRQQQDNPVPERSGVGCSRDHPAVPPVPRPAEPDLPGRGDHRAEGGVQLVRVAGLRGDGEGEDEFAGDQRLLLLDRQRGQPARHGARGHRPHRPQPHGHVGHRGLLHLLRQEDQPGGVLPHLITIFIISSQALMLCCCD